MRNLLVVLFLLGTWQLAEAMPSIDTSAPTAQATVKGVSPAINVDGDLSMSDPRELNILENPITQFGYENPNVPLRFKLMLGELLRVREAAQMAGGDVEITVKPVGFKMADFVVPLQRVGFDVRVTPAGEVVVSSPRDSSDLAMQKASLQAEVNALRETRRHLLSDVESLKNCVTPATTFQELVNN